MSVASVLLIEESRIFDHLLLDKVVWFEKYAAVIKNTSSRPRQEYSRDAILTLRVTTDIVFQQIEPKSFPHGIFKIMFSSSQGMYYMICRNSVSINAIPFLGTEGFPVTFSFKDKRN